MLICSIRINDEWSDVKKFSDHELASSFLGRNVSMKDEAMSFIHDEGHENGRTEVFRLKNGSWKLSRVLFVKKMIGEVKNAVLASEPKVGVKKYLDEVYKRNLDAECKDRIDESPEVGLFWIDTETAKVYGDSIGIREADTLGVGTKNEFCVHPSCHYSLWPKVRELNDKWKDKHYEDVARGRVIFVKEPDNRHFEVYVSPMAKGDKFEAAIRSFFSLPHGTVFHYDDDHYVPVE